MRPDVAAECWSLSARRKHFPALELWKNVTIFDINCHRFCICRKFIVMNSVHSILTSAFPTHVCGCPLHNHTKLTTIYLILMFLGCQLFSILFSIYNLLCFGMVCIFMSVVVTFRVLREYVSLYNEERVNRSSNHFELTQHTKLIFPIAD